MPDSDIVLKMGSPDAYAPAVFTYLYFVNAWAPEISPDGASYHVPLMQRYLRAHRFERVPTDVYSSLSEGVELVFLPAIAIGGGSGAALVHFAFLIATVLAVRAYGKYSGHPIAGEAAASLTYLSPVVGVDGTSAYVDVATAAVAFSCFFWTQIWDGDRRKVVLICAGIMAGYCYAAKYTAAVMVVYALAYVCWRARKVGPLLIVAAAASIMAAPWILKDWIYFNNPIAPFGNTIFRNPYIHPSFESEWTQFLRTCGVATRWRLPRDLLSEGEVTQTPIGPIFALLPLCLLSLRRSIGKRVLLPGSLLLVTYFANVGSRFLIPCLPFFALALSAALDFSPMALALIVGVHALLSWPPYLGTYSKAPFVLRHVPIKAALRIQSEDSYLSNSSTYRAARMIEQAVPLGAKVLAMSGVAEAYTSRDVLVEYQGALNQQMGDALAAGWNPLVKPTRALVFRFPEHAFKGIRVLQTALITGSAEQWSVHEFRVRYRRREVQRQHSWRLRAFPNSWGVPYAFDNSDATRWRTWEPAAPGMYIEVEFETPTVADEVEIVTSSDDPNVRLRLEETNGAGRWTTVAQAPLEFTLTVETSLRWAAAAELKRNGIGYVFVYDNDAAHGGDSFANDSASWNFKPVAHDGGGTVYKIGP